MKRTRLAAFGPAVVLAACSSPSPVLYTIAPVQGQVLSGAPKIIELHQISIARYLERSQIVASSENYRLDVMENDWWGEPLGAMLSRVLVDELSQRLPQSTVIGETGAVTASPDATVELNVQRLDEDGAGSLVLQAQASVDAKSRGGPVLRQLGFTVPPTTPGIPGEVTAISTAVGKLADGLVSMLTTGR